MASGKNGSAPERKPDEVRADMALAREQVRASVDGLRGEVTRLSDWRGWFVKRPFVLVGGALIAGFVLGRRGSPRLATAIVGLGALGELAMQVTARRSPSTRSLDGGQPR